ncbi:MAG: hypothetical protein ACI8Z7_000304 [Candidatus Nanohaloarchaea archaeon]|jgi:hypothetical protein
MSTIDEKARNYIQTSGITAEMIGFLRDREETLECDITSVVPGDRMNSTGNGAHIAGLIENLDSSRDEFGTSYWRGMAREVSEGVYMKFNVEYGASDSQSDLPPRASFLDENYDTEDPYDIITEPLEITVKGELEMDYRNADIFT